jgi:hypothetical protein
VKSKNSPATALSGLRESRLAVIEQSIAPGASPAKAASAVIWILPAAVHFHTGIGAQ